MRQLRSYVNGTWTTGNGTGATLYNATTGEAIATASTDGIDRGAALNHARTVGGPALRAMTFAERAAVLKAMSGVIHAHRDELIAMSTENYGATRSDGKFDVDGASGTLAYYGSVGRRLGDKTFLLDGDAEQLLRSARFVGQHIFTSRQGVAIHINAFNFPAWGMAEKLAVSILAGVPAIVKPATSTAMVTERIVELWTEAGVLPEGSVSLLCGSAGDLLDHVERQDVVAFTGGSDTASKIRGHKRVVALNVPVNIEADSLNAAILGPNPKDETFEMFLGQVITELSQKAGQKCTAIRRIFVPTAQIDRVREMLGERLLEIRTGLPTERGIRVGPLSNASQLETVRAGMDELAKEASVFLEGQGDLPAEGYFVRPTVFYVEEGNDAPYVHSEEVFGPVTTIIGYSGSAADAIELANRGQGGLAASVYADDRAWAAEVLLGIAPYHGRVQWGCKKIADQSSGHGTVLPNLNHGGPGRAGGGGELGGLRGLAFYMQRTAIQGDRGLLGRVLGTTDA